MLDYEFTKSEACGWRGANSAIGWLKEIWDKNFSGLLLDIVDNFISYCLYPNLYDAEYIDWGMEFNNETDITKLLDDFIFILCELSKTINHNNVVIIQD